MSLVAYAQDQRDLRDVSDRGEAWIASEPGALCLLGSE